MPLGDSLYRRIYAVVRRVPRGRVTTYGQVARLAEAATPRIVGYALAALPEGTRVAWHRVINARGELSPRGDGDGPKLQRALLMAEGVVFDRGGRVDLARFGWHPRRPGGSKSWN